MKKVLFLIAVSIVFISCSSDDDAFTELSKNRQLWQSKNIDSYKWNERLSCFCGGILIKDVIVLNSQKDSVEFEIPEWYPPETTVEDLYDGVFENAKTIEDAFDLIEDLQNQTVDALIIEYNETYGFPTLISVDYSFQIADDEFVYTYSNFEEPFQLHQ